ncbi:unnamed protein product [Anisakis simplex]|uniref:DUF721 domain-containing protein n=1 Tax=Anisakis simplex TaxID=6269 RepID=A0A0M3JD95_ANISI|nr:unnamed protein product [Anisakis simplex]
MTYSIVFRDIRLSEVLSSKKVLLLESGDPKPLGKTKLYSNRVSAITPSSLDLFKRLGIWNKLQEYRVKRVDRLEVLDSCSKSAIRLQPPDPRDEVAYIIENNAMVEFLSERVREKCQNVVVKTKMKVEDCW